MDIRLDEGFQFGLGIFETIAVEEGRLLLLDRHLQRMEKAARFFDLGTLLERGVTKERINEFLAEQKAEDIRHGAIKIILSKENLIFQMRRNPYTEEVYLRGFVADISKVRRNETSPMVYHKTLNYGDCILEKRAATAVGIQERIFMNTKGQLCEGTVSNIFFVRKNKIYTPQLLCGLLPGILREYVLEISDVKETVITILSRCQRYDFHRISIDTIADRLTELLHAEGVEAEEKAVRYVAKAGDGSMRDALSLLDQCIAFYLGQTLTYDKVLEVLGAVDTEVFSKLLRKVLTGDVTAAIRILEELIVGGRELSQFVGDFTWYMRNLLLVKTSDNPEEAIDVSSENLRLLKEESEMTDIDTLMRYIRVFSELSNQIRFATQKRVLVEIALIKLCRPAMETNLDSVLDRLRVLEQRIDERPVQQVVVRSGDESVTEMRTEPVVPPQKAAPEDLQKIVAGWKVIVGQTTAAFKQALLQSVPKYNGETGEPVLYVEFQTPLGRLYPDDSDAKKELQEIIEKQLGKSIELHMLVAEDHQQTNLSQITVDQAIRENIHMDVQIEEEPGSHLED